MLEFAIALPLTGASASPPSFSSIQFEKNFYETTAFFIIMCQSFPLISGKERLLLFLDLLVSSYFLQMPTSLSSKAYPNTLCPTKIDWKASMSPEDMA